MRHWLKSVLKISSASFALLITGALVADRILPPPLDRIDNVSTLVQDRSGDVLRAYQNSNGAWRLPADLDKVDPKFVRFLLSYEDHRFHDHPGLDPLALGRAAWQAVKHGRIVSGGSTITMQLSRLLEPRSRTMTAKLVEMARALQIEARLDKDAILASYLTLAPYGGNLEGVRAASLAYFGKEPSYLTDAEAALLVVLPQSPETTRPDRHAKAAELARNKVLALMLQRGLLDLAAYQTALDEPMPTGRRAFPNLAPHFADRVISQRPNERIIESSLDGDLQHAAMQVVVRHHQRLEPRATIAVLVVENEGRYVRAYIGSGDYFSQSRSGQNDMVRAIRSPGSALKPFIYGMGFEDLAVHPETIMPDVALRFGDYAPKNFDNYFRGEITAREALQASLNLPAVALLDRIGPQRFAMRMAEAGVTLSLPNEAKAPGLPIALGGVGISLEELVSLYADLADVGKAQALTYEEEPTANADTEHLLSESAAFYVTRILMDSPPPPSYLAAGNRKGASEIAYKTGTSYGFRDAWAIGYTRDYTVGVWVGRPDGTFSPDRMGRVAAAPILFEIFDLLPSSPAALPATPPAGVIVASTRALPVNLQKFQLRAGTAKSNNPAPSRVKITFPVDGATLELATANDDLLPMVLTATGGAMPLRWLVNGKPVESIPYRRQTEWQPDGRGAVRVTVIDQEGHSASSAIWIK